MSAFHGSSTRKYTTASTRTVTLSRVMPSWAGTGSVTIWVFTFRSRSTKGIIVVSPGSRACGSARPKRKTMPRSNWLTTRTLKADQAAATAAAPTSNSAIIATPYVTVKRSAGAHTGRVTTIPVELVAEAEAAARAAADRYGLRVAELHDVAEQEAAVDLLCAVWGTDSPQDLVNVSLLRALAHSGNYVAGAYAADRLVGAAVAFFGIDHLHSHITGVDRTAQAKGVGYALKQHQRGWALARGLTHVCWTFDPLVRRNAWFNLHKLGATATVYLPDFYGALADGINAGDASDRLYIDWRLDALAGDPDAADARMLLDAAGDEPVVAPSPPGDGALLVSVPEDIESLRRRDRELAVRWRYAVRDALLDPLNRGYRISGITRDGRYVLERG